MLYISMNTYDNQQHDIIKWHVGMEHPDPSFTVTEIWADREELEYIREHFKNIPDAPTRSVVTWFGNIAQFIVENLL